MIEHAERADSLQRTIAPFADEVEAAEEAEDTSSSERIRCPLCGWQPDASSRWWCSDCDWPEYFHGGCQTSWNTFETGGVCPGCSHRWQWTMCLRCQGWARHSDWYAADDERA